MQLIRYFDRADYDDVPACIVCCLHEVVKETDKGYWIEYNSARKFILKGKGRRWAYDNDLDAWASFRIRKEKQKQHLYNALRRCEYTIELITRSEVKWEFKGNGDVEMLIKQQEQKGTFPCEPF